MLSTLVTPIVRYFKESAMQRRAINELSRLSDRELSDLGITRCEIESIVKYTVRGVR
jgi:uncharacterized protein YjiS (DUF1127 family)